MGLAKEAGDELGTGKGVVINFINSRIFLIFPFLHLESFIYTHPNVTVQCTYSIFKDPPPSSPDEVLSNKIHKFQ